MPFQFSEGNQQYHPPVAPELPARVNMPQGDFVGNSIVNGMVHRAIASEQAQLDQQRMLQTADLQAKELSYKDKWQQQDYEIAKQNADSLSSYRSQEAEWHKANKDQRDALAAAKLEQQARAKALIESAMTSVNEFDNKAIPAAQPIMDQQRILDNPGATLVDIGGWMQKYGGATVGAAPEIEKQLKTVAKGMQVPWADNAAYVDSKGNAELTDKNDPLAWRVPVKTDPATGITVWRGVQPTDIRQRPLEEVANLYADPVNRQQAADALIAAGHGTVEKTEDTMGWNIWHPLTRKSTATTQTPTLDPWANKLLLKLGQKRAQYQSEVPPAARIPLKKWQVEAGIAKGEPSYGGTPSGIEQDPAEQEAAYVNANDPDGTLGYRSTFLSRHPDRADLVGQ